MTHRPSIPKDLSDHLENEKRTFMVTLRSDGSPTCHPMGTFFAEGQFFLNMYAKSSKNRNLERDQRIACLVTTGPEAPDFRAVICQGTGRLLAPEETLADDAPAGVRKALRMDVAESPATTEGSNRQYTKDDPEDLVKRTTAMRQRIRDGARVLWQVEFDRVGWIEDVRGVN